MRNLIAAMIARLPKPLRGDGALLAAFLAAAVLLLLFGHLASEMLEGETLAIDRHILRGLRTAANAAVPIGPKWLTQVFVDVTALGGAPLLTLVTLASIGLLFALRKPATALFVAAAVGCGTGLAALLKLLFARVRPEIVPHLVDATGLSFPSGHATNSAIVYLTLGALLANAHERPAVRAYLIGVAMLLTVAIGVSRIWLGVHWPSDVVGGWCAGAGWALACWSVERTLQHRRTIEPAPADTD